VVVVLVLIQTKQIYIDETIQKHSTKIQNTVNTSIRITKTPTHTHTRILRNKLKQLQCKFKQTQYKIYPHEIVAV